jgi:hypothetical protein
MLMVRTALSRFKEEATGRRKRALDNLLGDENTKFREVKETTICADRRASELKLKSFGMSRLAASKNGSWHSIFASPP